MAEDEKAKKIPARKPWPGTPLGQWLAKNDAHFYYLVFLEKKLEGCTVEYGDNDAYIMCKGYIISRFVFCGQSIYLTMPKEKIKSNYGVVQNKLLHEYLEAFSLDIEDFKLTQQNFIVYDRYFKKARKKIDAGFDKYMKLMDERKLEESNSAYLKICIDNAFSVTELNTLISAYNQLYSLVYCICEYGCDEVEYMDMKEVLNKHSMVLESISIGSTGFWVSVLEQVVAAGIVAICKGLLGNSDSEYAAKKQELIDLARRESEDVGEKVYRLTVRLDGLLRMKEAGRVPNSVLDTQINSLYDEISRLQGTPHIDIYY